MSSIADKIKSKIKGYLGLNLKNRSNAGSTSHSQNKQLEEIDALLDEARGTKPKVKPKASDTPSTVVSWKK